MASNQLSVATEPVERVEVPATTATERSGPMARLGAWSATHLRVVLLLWLFVLAVFGAFAPQVEHALAGAGWQDSTSQSVQARAVIQRDFGGLGATALQVVIVDHRGPIATDAAAQSVLTKVSKLAARRPPGLHRCRTPAGRLVVARTAGRQSSAPVPPRTPTPWSAPPTPWPDPSAGSPDPAFR